MRKIFLLLITIGLLNASFFGSSKKQKLSDIKPASMIYIELSSNTCNNFCLNDLLNNGLYLSFLANYTKSSSDQVLDNIYAKLTNSITDFLIKKQHKNKVKIALIIPHKQMKSISSSVINSSLAYLIKKQDNIDFKVFLTNTDAKASMQKAIDEIKNNDYLVVISLNTENGAKILSDELTEQILYFPNLKKEDTNISAQNVKFGGIDYDNQLDALLEVSNGKLAIITDKDILFQKLNAKLNEKTFQQIYTITKDPDKNPMYILKNNKKLENASIFLNLKIVDTSLFASQIRAYEVNPKALLATQVAFHPALLRISQNEDLTQLYIANSLQSNDDELNYINEFLGVNLNYNWIAYSTSAGLDNIYSQHFTDDKRYFENNFVDNSLVYPVYIYKVKNKSFYKFK